MIGALSVSAAGSVGSATPATSRSLNSMANGSNRPENPSPLWPVAQVVSLAAVCLLVGLVLGDFLRGSAPAANSPHVAATESAAPAKVAAMPAGMGGGTAPHPAPSLDDMKRMADKKAEPLLAKLKTDPNNAETLNDLGILY